MNKNIYSVSQVNNYIKFLLEDDVLLNNIFIEGEISNFKKHTSGNLYFSIKDDSSSINTVMYKNNAFGLDFQIQNGMKVTAFGYVSSYPKIGQYQFNAKTISALGKGDLQKEFELLKQKLLKQGIFDESNKKPIPKLPKNIGVITSPTGAAIQDIINIYKRRNKTVSLTLIPSLVQGEAAPREIIDAITTANEYGKLDTIILARGGGSFEDLNCFNDEALANAIFLSKIPIITGIGHEIDFTIADFVADFRAPTPSAAIEIALPEADILQERLSGAYFKISEIMNQKVENFKNKYNTSIKTPSFKNFLGLVTEHKADVEKTLNELEKTFDFKLKENKLLFNNLLDRLNLISPTNILKYGYAIVSDEAGKEVKSSKALNQGDIININFYDGEKKAKIF